MLLSSDRGCDRANHLDTSQSRKYTFDDCSDLFYIRQPVQRSNTRVTQASIAAVAEFAFLRTEPFRYVGQNDNSLVDLRRMPKGSRLFSTILVSLESEGW
jgi:hypothetical protein